MNPRLAALVQTVAAALQAGDEAGAENALRQIVAEDPRHAEAWHMLAALGVRTARAEEAIECALRAHQLDRRNAQYLNTLGIAYAEARQFQEALRCFRRSLKERPNRSDSHYNLGKTFAKLEDWREATRCFERAHQLDPDRLEIVHNLVALHVHQGRYREALSLITRARSRNPDDVELALYNALAALATSGPDAMFREFAAFLERHPDSVPVREEFSLRLLAQGMFAEGWREYALRRVRPAVGRAGELRDRRVLLLPEQGLGDQLFFLRFAPRLRERAASIAFDCPEKLAPLLAGNGVVDLLPAGATPADFDVVVPVGDLPEALEDWTTPPAFALAPRRVSAWRERLAALGPPPYLGVTWRAGTRAGRRAEFGAREEGALDKEIAIAPLAAALRGWRGTVLVLQRLPLGGEVEKFSAALGRRAHDLSALNEDLEDIAAVLALIDEYVGVSNTNMHIRAGLKKNARVLVPFPPEFRWTHDGGESPWFPGFVLYRQSPERAWQRVLDTLRNDLSR